MVETSMPPPLAGKIEQQFIARADKIGIGEPAARDVFASILPKEGEVLPDPLLKIDLASAKGKEYITGLLHTGTYWRDRVAAVKQKLTSEPGHGTEVLILDELSAVVGEVVPSELAAKVEAGEVADLAEGIRSYIGDQVLAQLTDTAQPLPTRDQFGRSFGVAEYNTRQLLGITEATPELYKATQTSPENFTKGSVDFISTQRSRQRIYTEAVVARYLQGVPVETQTVNRQGITRTNVYTRPEGQIPEVAQKYAEAFTTALDSLDQSLNIDSARHAELSKQNGYDHEPITYSHEQLLSNLFAGIQFPGNLSPGVDLREVVNTDNQEQITSFTRGVALRTIIEGGNIETYLVALTALPAERQQMGSVARQVWDSLAADSPQRRNLSELLLTAHSQELQATDQAIFRTELETAIGGPKALQEVRRKIAESFTANMRSQVEGFITQRQFENFSYRSPASSELVKAFSEGTEANRREKAAVFARQVVFGQVASDIAARYIQPSMDAFIKGEESLLDVSNQSARVQEALRHLDLVDLQMNSYGNEPIKLNLHPEQHYGTYGSPTVLYEVPQDLRSLVIEASFSRDLLGGRERKQNDYQVIQSIGAYFRQANEFGVAQANLIEIHNKTVLAVVAANRLIGERFAPDPYRETPINFNDVLLNLGPNITGVRAVNFTSAGQEMRSFNPEGRGEGRGYWIYAPANDTSFKWRQWSDGYQIGERRTGIDQRVREGLDPVFTQGRKLTEVKDMLATESRMASSTVFEKHTSETGRYGNDKVFSQDESVVKSGAEGAAVAKQLEQLDADIQQLKTLHNVSISGSKSTNLSHHLSDWKFNYLDPIEDSRIEKVKMKAGYNEAGQIKKAIEAKIAEIIRKKVDISDADQREKALKEVEDELNRRKKERATEFAQKLDSVARAILPVDTRIAEFIHSRTTPKADVTTGIVSETLRIPVVTKEERTDIVRIQQRDINLATEDLEWSEFFPARKLVPLFDLQSAQYTALSTPIQEAVGKLEASLGYGNEVAPAKEALRRVKIALGNKHDVAKALGTSLALYFRQATGKRIDQFDINTINPTELATVAGGDIQRAFEKEVESLKRTLESRKSPAKT